MTDKKKNRKNTIASLAIFFNTATLLIGIALLMLGFALLFESLVVGAVEEAIAIFVLSRYAEMCHVIDHIQEYGPLMINHPEYTVSDYAKGVHREQDVVVKQFNTMIKRKVMFGSFDASKNYFRIDDDFDLKALMVKKKWTNALFMR